MATFDLIPLLAGGSRRPRIPTRAEACTIRISFQGLTIQSRTYGPLPWFTAGLTSMAAVGELDATLDQLIAAGDTHAQIDLAWSYGESGQPWGTLVPGRDLRDDLPTYVAICDRVIQRGLKPIFVMPSEGQDGLQWTYANLSRIVSALRDGYDRTRYGPFQYGYDGTWPASYSVQDMQTFLPWQRGIIGDAAYALMYFANGPSGSPYLYVVDESDYSKPWMQALDIMLTSTRPDQVECPALPNYGQYMLGSLLTPTSTCRPSFDAPGWIRNAPRGMMAPGTPRGDYFWGVIEYLEYQWVRGWVTAADVATARARIASIGAAIYG